MTDIIATHIANQTKPNRAHKNNATIHDCACLNKESHSGVVRILVLQVAGVQILPVELLGTVSKFPGLQHANTAASKEIHM